MVHVVPDRPIEPVAIRSAVAQPEVVTRRSRLRGSHGLRSGVVLGVATLVFSISGYLFQTACIRYLGPARYSDVAAMLALTAVIAIPLGSVQTLVAREVAYLDARGARRELRGFLRRTMAIAVPAALAVTALAMALTVPIERTLGIASPQVVIAGLAALFSLIVGAILYGFLQGAQRFRALAVNLSLSGIAKPVMVVPVLLVGLGAAGALTVNALAALGAVALAAWALRDVWGGRAPAGLHPPLVFDRREVVVLAVGSLAFASLTNLDIVLARYYLEPAEAGVYAAAALIGKFVLLMPASVVTVLLPKAASRAAAGEASQRILLMSAGVTLVLTLAATVVLTLVPESLLVRAFGPDFRDATALLGWFGLAMTAAALVNVYLFVYLAHRDFSFPLLVGAAAVAQIAIVAVWHSEPRDIVLATVVSCTAVMAIHELAFPNGLVRIWRRRAIA